MGDPKRLLTGSGGHRSKGSDVEEGLLPLAQNGSGSQHEKGANGHGTGRRRSFAGVERVGGRVLAVVARTSWTNRLVLVALVLFFLKVVPLPYIFSTPSLPHPIPDLIGRAEAEHARRLSSEPQTLEEAYKLYVARHGRRPPKGYDGWYNFAVQRGACRIDGFDEMYRSLGVWWGLEGSEIRDRMDRLGKAGHGGLGRVRIRHGRLVRWREMLDEGLGVGAANLEGSQARTAWEEMLDELIREGVRLPDADFFINQLDEPRVVMPYELRTDLENRGKRRRPRSPAPEEPVFFDLGWSGARPAYDTIRQSCPPSSAARRAALSPAPGTKPHVSQRYTSAFTVPPRLGSFLSNAVLERRSWCDQPDLQELHQTLIRPLSFSWTEQPFPVFSNSKLEGFNDILVPTWYHWYQEMPYREHEDVEWKGKANQLYWRGTNTGGRSIGLSWMGWMRSRLVSKMNRLIEWRHYDQVILAGPDNKTLTTTLPSSALNTALADVAFASPDRHGDSESLETQSTEPSFRFTGLVPFANNFLFKAILDMDGTAYSGRFPALMASRSAVIKSRLFLEAFDDTLIPWYHYIPLSIRFSELYNLLAYFFGLASVPSIAETQGFPAPSSRDFSAIRRGRAHEEELYAVAMRGREWAQKCARRDDALIYAYLLALEWARITADHRESDQWSLLL
ncbi:capsular associated protein, glycosyltransferase family 90 protein [Rhodotorula toruloides]|uniref:Glycosyl transferase CAP10 domain-containing protein n=1 Tax=Rhodotorula toruloides TaxID=5286 RepID=A0A0K3CLV6_RHOTO|nr:capsular associated protein, glycosyltransferase family 90 protein [Rhodotorula toruloides]PRQ71896.1 hypothetical protein AAT19DRAFT_10011 [Rhodotorula toruloides]